MEKINALFKSHRLRISVKTTKPNGEGEGHKSAPCTPCLNREIMLIPPNDSHGSTTRLAHLDCAGSTPRLSSRLDCHAAGPSAACGPSTSHDFDAIDVLDGQELGGTAELCPAAAVSHHYPDVRVATNEKTRQSRRHRGRERHRTSHRVPSGLDRSWEARRIEGLEMLQHSIEQRRERHCPREPSLPDQVTRDRSKSRSDSNRCQHRVQPTEPTKLPELRVCIERRLLELSHQLTEERQKSRQDRLTIAKLQQELARHKSEHPLREVLMKELERERRLRIEAENRLRDERLDTCDCKSHVTELQKELSKAKEFAHSLMPYKAKYERLKEDHTSITMSFKSQLESSQSEADKLMEENHSLLSDVTRLQKACAGCRLCSQNADCRLSVSGASHSDDSVASGADKTKVLLERLKMLEAEKTCLVLENEKQSEQYEKCLDDITSQVLQALMTQRSLKEECCKLRGRVFDLQRQNTELRELFTHSGRTATHNHSHTQQELPVNGVSPWDGQQSVLADLSLTFGSLTSMFSDHEQMQYLASRLESPTNVEFPVDLNEPASPAPDNNSSNNNIQRLFTPAARHFNNNNNKSSVTVDKQSQSVAPAQNTDSTCETQTAAAAAAAAADHTGSTVSLNELLDSFHADETELTMDAGLNDTDMINDWSHCGGGEGLGGHDDEICDEDNNSANELTKLVECKDFVGGAGRNNSCHSRSVSAVLSSPDNGYAGTFSISKFSNPMIGKPGAVMCRSADSAMLQRSFTESCTSSSTTSSEPTVRLLDDGYHSNSTSVMSPDGCHGNVPIIVQNGRCGSGSPPTGYRSNAAAGGTLSKPPDVVADCNQSAGYNKTFTADN